jgi:putative ABC transport system permease protein
LSIGRGAQATITQRIESTGSNLIFVRPGGTTQGNVRMAVGTAATLTLQDAQALAEPGLLPHVLAVAPQVQTFGQAVFGASNAPARVLGTTPSAQAMSNYTLADGDFFTDQQVQARSLVAVLGSNIANTLFPDTSPIGQTIRINRQPIRVIGVLQSQGGTALGIRDDQILMPVTTVITRLQASRTTSGGQNVQSITAQAVDGNSVDIAKNEIAEVLRQRHRIQPGADDDFNITTQQDILSTLTQATSVFTIFLGAIAGISLVVGGIGIMNIMLVSVAERTHEIGLRKAVGAKRRHVLAQFLVESIVLSGLGGATGVLLGIALSRGVGCISLNGQNLPSVVTPDIVVLAVGVSVAIGLFFGIYPASRASRLDPIQALRHE